MTVIEDRAGERQPGARDRRNDPSLAVGRVTTPCASSPSLGNRPVVYIDRRDDEIRITTSRCCLSTATAALQTAARNGCFTLPGMGAHVADSSERCVPVAILLALTLGCGDKNPVTPSRPGPANAGLTISGPDALLTGLSANYAVTATMTDGTTRTVVPTWTSSNPGVARVDGSGRLEGRSHGSTMLTASSGGLSASRIVQVVNNYAGSWTGRFIIRACTDTGELTDHDGGFCLAGPGRPGSTGWITLTLVQSGSTLSEITGTIGNYSEPITGAVSADGRLSLSGTVTARDLDDPNFTIATHSLGAWDTRLNGSDGMTGGWSDDFTSLVSCLGTAHIEHELLTMSRAPR